MSNSKQILFGLVGVLICVVGAGIMTGIRNTGSWAEFQAALKQKQSSPRSDNQQSENPTSPTPEALRFAGTKLNDAVNELLAYARDTQAADHEMIYEENWPLEIKQLRPANVRYVVATDALKSEGIFFVLDRQKEHDLGIVRWADVRPALVEPKEGHATIETSMGGFRSLPITNVSWHWYKP